MSAADMVAQVRQGTLYASFPRGAVPTAADTAKAKKDAHEVLGWLRANLAQHRASADVARELEDLLFNVGSIRMLWALMPDEDAAGRYLMQREDLNSRAPFEVQCAFAKAEGREHEERAAMFEAVHKLRMDAGRLQSERLSKAADIVEQMQGFFRVEPDGPGKAAQKATGKRGQRVKSAPIKKTENAMNALYKKGYVEDEKGTRIAFKSPNHAAELLKGQALELAKKNGHQLSEKRIVLTLGDWFRAYDKAQTITAGPKR